MFGLDIPQERKISFLEGSQSPSTQVIRSPSLASQDVAKALLSIYS